MLSADNPHCAVSSSIACLIASRRGRRDLYTNEPVIKLEYVSKGMHLNAVSLGYRSIPRMMAAW